MLTWRKGNLRGGANEIEELKGAIAVLLELGNIKQGQGRELLEYAESQYRSAPVVNLSNVNWSRMANTGSWFDNNYSEIKTFKQLFRNLRDDGERRNVSRIVSQFMGEGEINDFNGTVDCPICLKLNATGGVVQQGKFLGPLYLVGGNTRLTVAKILGVPTKIVEINVDW
jgi:hypothetical protein|tara:strand:+ start:2554 stop:3063 length:510 start_codon:yes stop_codon:yes gene_type:complete